MAQQNRLLPLIGLFKLAKAAMLYTLAFALRYLRHGDAPTILLDWARVVRIDPESHLAHAFVSKVTGLPAGRLHELGIGTFLYALLFTTEGLGLVMRQTWAEYFTIISTSLFLPLEIWELFHPGRRLAKLVLLLLNVAVVIYLVLNLTRARRREAAGNEAPVKAAAKPE